MANEIEKIKAELPEVKVKFLGKLHVCRTYGRGNKFCTVGPVEIPGISWEYAWETIARHIKTGKPLLV